MPPLSVVLFLENLLKHSKHTSDFINGVRNDEFLTSKHFLLGLELHSITGQKKPVKIGNRLGKQYDL